MVQSCGKPQIQHALPPSSPDSHCLSATSVMSLMFKHNRQKFLRVWKADKASLREFWSRIVLRMMVRATSHSIVFSPGEVQPTWKPPPRSLCGRMQGRLQNHKVHRFCVGAHCYMPDLSSRADMCTMQLRQSSNKIRWQLWHRGLICLKKWICLPGDLTAGMSHSL